MLPTHYVAILTHEQREALLQLARVAHHNARTRIDATPGAPSAYDAEQMESAEKAYRAMNDAAPVPETSTVRATACIKACEALTIGELWQGGAVSPSRHSQLTHERNGLLRIAQWAEAALGYLMAKAPTAQDRAEFRLRLGITQAALAPHRLPMANRPAPVPTTIGELRDQGYAVVLFEPDELAGMEPRRLEADLAVEGLDRIGAHAEATPAARAA
jgi:hypothetical protein